MADRENALSKLYTRLIDSRDGYRDAAERADSAHIKQTLTELGEKRTRDAAELRSHLARMGHELDEDGSILASAHRTFLGIKDSVTGQGDDAIIAEIVRGEESLHDAYHTALEASTPGQPEYAMLKEQHDALYARIQAFKAQKAA